MVRQTKVTPEFQFHFTFFPQIVSDLESQFSI
jgi:hypothetical protein